MTKHPFTIEVYHDATQASLRCPECETVYPIPKEQVKTVLERATPEHDTTCRDCTETFAVLSNFHIPTQLHITG